MRRTDNSDGGPAFAVSTVDGFTEDGMSLRDYFAGHALAGICASNEATFLGYHPGKSLSEGVASDAYEIADAMLKARDK